MLTDQDILDIFALTAPGGTSRQHLVAIGREIERRAVGDRPESPRRDILNALDRAAGQLEKQRDAIAGANSARSEPMKQSNNCWTLPMAWLYLMERSSD